MNIFILLSINFVYGFLGNIVSNAKPLPYEAIFNFGDSFSDTGNAGILYPQYPGNKNPYGSTHFKHPTGRMSDGRLMIDFIAKAYGFQNLPVYMNLTKAKDIKKGVNFAVSGATALHVEYFKKRGGYQPTSDKSLSVQLDWFKKLKPSLCKRKECDNYFKKSLFLVGEIGGNDIISLLSLKNETELQKGVPLIIQTIANVTTALIEEGAVELAVPGNVPIGCSAGTILLANSTKKSDYDQFGCLLHFNTFIENYNKQLKHAIKILRKKYRQAKIIYLDYYNDTKRLYQAPAKYGFSSDKNEALKACCVQCGSSASKVCPNPSKYISWDGVHFTEATYKLLAKGLLEGHFAHPSLRPPPFKIA